MIRLSFVMLFALLAVSCGENTNPPSEYKQTTDNRSVTAQNSHVIEDIDLGVMY